MMRSLLGMTVFWFLFSAPVAGDSPKVNLPEIKIPNPPLNTKSVKRLMQKIDDTDGGEALGELYDDLASEYGRSGQWKEAANYFHHAAEADPDQSRYWMRRGVALLLAKDYKEYKTWIEKMAVQFAGTDDYYAVERVAKMSVVWKDAVGKKANVIKLAKESVQKSSKSSWAEYFPSTEAMVHYRFGNYDQSLKSLEHSNRINERAGSKDVTAINLAIESLCLIKQGHHEQAIVSLRKANTLLRTAFADPDLVVQYPGYWHDWMIANTLYEEAVELLKLPRHNQS